MKFQELLYHGVGVAVTSEFYEPPMLLLLTVGLKKKFYFRRVWILVSGVCCVLCR
jgi:hypothetical protein